MENLVTRRLFLASAPFVLTGLTGISARAAARQGHQSVQFLASLEDQRAQLYIGGKPAYPVWKISSASSQNTDCTYGACVTETGTCEITRVDAHAYSKKWKCPMDNAVFFAKRDERGKLLDVGDAVHAATPDEINQLGHVASHGCIRVAPENAVIFFGVAAENRRGNSWPNLRVVILPGKLPASGETPVAEEGLKI
jgi:hypothetical protein